MMLMVMMVMMAARFTWDLRMGCQRHVARASYPCELKPTTKILP
jgi:hypothetical protein